MTKVLCDLDLSTWMYRVPIKYRESLQDNFKDVFFHYCACPTPDEICEYDIYWGNRFPTSGFSNIKESHLKWLHFGSVGVDRFLSSDYPNKKIILTSSRGTVDEGFVSHALHLIFTLLRAGYAYNSGITQKNWTREFLDDKLVEITNIHDLSVLLVGMGSLASKLAKSLHALGAKVDGCRINNEKIKPFGFTRQYSIDALLEIAPYYDMVISVLPGTRSLENFYGKEFFARLSGSFFVNLGRGSHVDENELIKALNSNLKAAALDVVKNEPLQASDALLNIPNLYITPHIGGYDSLYWSKQLKLFSMNLESFVASNNNQSFVNQIFL